MSQSSPIVSGKVAVVIAAYNEANSIGNVFEDIHRTLPDVLVIIVNDGSRDQTAEILENLPVYHLSHAVNLGQGAALQTGIEYAGRLGAQYIVTFDADGQHRASDIPRLIAPLTNGECDIALGSRFLDSQSAEAVPVIRRVILRLATWFTRVTTGLSVTDSHNGLRAFTIECIRSLEMRMNGMSHASELLSLIGSSKFRWKEVPVTISYTQYSMTKGQSALNMFNILWDLASKK